MKIYKDTITNRNEKFEKLVLKTQEEMKDYVSARLGNFGNVKRGDGYVYHKGTFPVLLCAHMDTVHKGRINTLVYANGTLSSPQGIGGDDRCGIYMIFKILKEYDCHVVFLEDEEIGCVGAKKFATSKICKELKNEGLKYIIEFDRKGHNHAVTYDCDNKEFDDFITKEFFKKQFGTCSDISYIAPELGIAAVNLSCGYYKEHNIEEWVNLKEMETVIVEAKKILERTTEDLKPFEYIESKFKNNGYGYEYYDYDDYYYPSTYSYNRNKNKTNTTDTKKRYIFSYKYKGQACILESNIYTSSYADAMYEFFKIHRDLKFENLISVTEK